MKSIFNECIERIQHSKQRYRRYVAILLVLSLCTTLGVNWGLHQNGIAQTTDVQCGLDEHQHSAECYEKVLKCTDEEHKHTDSCYEKQLTCERQEHTHSVNCFSDTSKDVEDASVWEATLPTTLSGIWADDLVAVAESQLDYKESADNFEADESGVKKGYTRYGAFYGNEYADWSTMFAAFCLNYAGISTDYVPANSGCEAWIVDLGKAGLYRSADYTPSVGDMALLSMDAESGTGADHVGIISNIETDNAGNVSKITMVIGDNNDAVTEEVYSYNATEYTITPENETDVAGTVVGYCALPEQPEDSNTNTDADATTDITVDDTTADDTVNDTTADEPTGDATDVVDGADDANTDTNVEPSDEPGTKTDDTNEVVDGDTTDDNTADTPSADESGDSTDTGSGKEVADDETSEAKKGGILDFIEDAIDDLLGDIKVDISNLSDTPVNMTADIMEAAEKPNYSDDASSVSDVIEKTTTIDGIDGNVTATSDAATSNIENSFNGESAQDGKVLTDKSVTYGKDDYGAFPSYTDGTFGVTMSALGQEFNVTNDDSYKVPIDVVFVLDVSNSMRETASGNQSKREAMVDAVNSAIKYIQDDDPQNRVGIALYSSNAATLLNLNRYKGNSSNQYIYINNNKLRTVRNLKTESGMTIDQTYGNLEQNLGTYTQAGIETGAKLLTNESTTTAQVTTAKGNTLTVQRQPVIILLSDGVPTHGNNNYSNVVNTQGSGNGSDKDNKVIEGYYTILTANYYKSQIASHYSTSAKFYTIGEGINKVESNSSDEDAYANAVLNPSKSTMNFLNQMNGTRVKRIKGMLNQTIDEGTRYNVGTSGSNGINADYAPRQYEYYYRSGIQQYPDYAYSDGSWFGSMNSSQLEAAFKTMVNQSTTVVNYDFALAASTGVTITDPIGTGMEVKGAPVLRYGSTNYTMAKQSESTEGDTTVVKYVCNSTTTYAQAYPENYKNDGTGNQSDHHQSDATIDLSQITVKVTTDNSTGEQTVTMDVPADLLPTYYPDSAQKFYYQETPVRLIYQVGLTESTIAAANNLEKGQELSYCTNKYENGTTATGTFSTSSSNTYSFDDADGIKTENATNTSTTYFTEGKTTSDSQKNVTQSLGNNGRITITGTKEKPKTTSLTVNKVWDDGSDKHSGDSITVYLYQDGEKTDKSVALNAKNNWTDTFNDLPLYSDEGSKTEYKYTVEEDVPDGYSAEYSYSTGDTTTGDYIWVPTYQFEDGETYIIVTSSGTGSVIGMEAASDGKSFQWKNGVEGKTAGSITVTEGSSYGKYITDEEAQNHTAMQWTATSVGQVKGEQVGTREAFTLKNVKTQTYAKSNGQGDMTTSPADKEGWFYYGYTVVSDSKRQPSNNENEWSYVIGSMNDYFLLDNNHTGDGGSTKAQTFYLYKRVSATSTGNSVTITNKKQFVLPQTGGVGTTPFTAAGVAVIGAALWSGHHLRRRRERRGE